MKGFNVKVCLNYIDAMDVLSKESANQNEGKTNPHIAYMVKKNKDKIGGSVYKDKPFLENFEQYSTYSKLKVEIKNKNLKKETKKGLIFDEDQIKKETEELEKEYERVILKYNDYMKKEVIIDKFYQIKVDYLPNMTQSLMDFLVEAKLILE